MNTVDLIKNAFNSSDACGQAIVIVLIVISMFVWCMIFNHGWTCLIERWRGENFLRYYSSLKGGRLRISKILEERRPECAVARLCSCGIRELQNILGMKDLERFEMQQTGRLPRKLSSDEIDRISTTINNMMASQSQMLEGQMVWLGSLASIAPMLGLFGTVWGVMVTFIGIVAAGGRPDIQAIAPGISGALLTTVAGLVVAIPALFANNGIVYLIQKIDLDMDSFAQDFIACLKVCAVCETQTVNAAPGIAERQRGGMTETIAAGTSVTFNRIPGNGGYDAR